jgi:osmotically-inducible protein OsmY
MKNANRFPIFGLILLIAGCSYNQRHSGYRSAGAYGEDVISSPPPVTTRSLPGVTEQGAGASGLLSEADRALAERVRQQFGRYGDLAGLAPRVEVSARNGTVTLTGIVPSEQDRKMIDAMVANTTGVTTLNDQLTVAGLPPATAGIQSDRSLADRVQQMLKNQPAVAAVASNVQVSEDHGKVTLAGIVPSQEDKNLILGVVRNTPGVVAVNDNLGVALQPTGRTLSAPADIFNLHVQGLSATDRTLAQRILDGLRTDTVLGSLLPMVDINVAGGKVTLQGTVQNEQQRRAITSAVRQAAGMDNVEDQLQVQLPR